MHIPQLIFGNLESCRKNTHFFSHQHCSGIILAEYYFSSEIKLIKLTGFLAMSNNFSTGLSLATFQKIMSACFIHPNQCERWCVLHGKVFDVIFKWKLYGICMLLAMRIVPNYIHNIPGFLWFAMKRLWNVFVAHTQIKWKHLHFCSSQTSCLRLTTGHFFPNWSFIWPSTVHMTSFLLS